MVSDPTERTAPTAVTAEHIEDPFANRAHDIAAKLGELAALGPEAPNVAAELRKLGAAVFALIDTLPGHQPDRAVGRSPYRVPPPQGRISGSVGGELVLPPGTDLRAGIVDPSLLPDLRDDLRAEESVYVEITNKFELGINGNTLLLTEDQALGLSALMLRRDRWVNTLWVKGLGYRQDVDSRTANASFGYLIRQLDTFFLTNAAQSAVLRHGESSGQVYRLNPNLVFIDRRPVGSIALEPRATSPTSAAPVAAAKPAEAPDVKLAAPDEFEDVSAELEARNTILTIAAYIAKKYTRINRVGLIARVVNMAASLPNIHPENIDGETHYSYYAATKIIRGVVEEAGLRYVDDF
jgi:hypothetical protein